MCFMSLCCTAMMVLSSVQPRTSSWSSGKVSSSITRLWYLAASKGLRNFEFEAGSEKALGGNRKEAEKKRKGRSPAEALEDSGVGVEHG